MAKRGICELCGFADDSYTIEENGTVMKVCKFCHDGYLEKMGLPPDSDKHVDDVTMTLDLDEHGNEAEKDAIEELSLKIPALDEQELTRVLTGTAEDKRVLTQAMRKRKVSAAESETVETVTAYVATKPLPETKEILKNHLKEKAMADKEAKQMRKRDEIFAAANQKIDDERISITSPEIALLKDARPKTNLDVATSESAGGVKFIDCFKYVFHRVVYAVFLGVIALAVSTVLAIILGWKEGLIGFAGGVGAVALSFCLMWYLSRCIALDRRALLLRIRQQEILFKSMTTDCYRELKTKFTVLKALSWLVNKLSLILPLITIVGTVIAGVILTFLQAWWIMPLALFGSAVAGILVYWIVKLFADLLSYKLDAERNQQIQQQTLLDILHELKK